MTLWSADGRPIASARTNTETSGWQFAELQTAIRLTPGERYYASFRAPRGQYAYIRDGLTAPVTRGPLATPRQGGIFRYGEGVPMESSMNYLVDITFIPD